MQYIFQHPMPTPWLWADILTLVLSVLVMLFIVKHSRHPGVALLEGFGFVFLYASIFENFAVVNGWYIYGRSLLMIGDVPLSVPLIEMDVLLTGLWLLEKMEIPDWCKPFIVGLLGMLQDFSLDPIAVRQVFTSLGVSSHPEFVSLVSLLTGQMAQTGVINDSEAAAIQTCAAKANIPHVPLIYLPIAGR